MNIDYPAQGDIPALRQLWKQAFGDEDAFLDRFFSAGYAPSRCRRVMTQGQLAAALYWFDCSLGKETYAYLYAIATDPAFRGKGLCRALMEDTHALLKEKGYAGTVLVPGEPGLFAMYEKMGYAVMSGADSFTADAGEPAAIHAATCEEYAAARRSFLPENGLLQEGENLSFLKSWADLYIGKNFVLAAISDGDTIQCPELLGDPSAAPGILAALGKKTGTFRIPGKHPFAMLHPLKPLPAPGYFGLAFD